MMTRTRALLASLAGGAALAGAAAAQLPEDRLISVNAISSPARANRTMARLEFPAAYDAEDRGRRKSADAAGKNWRSADSKSAAELAAAAAAYGDAVLFDEPQRALSLLREAIASRKAQIGPYTVEELRAAAAFAEVLIAPGDGRRAEALLRALEAHDAAGANDTEITARAWFWLAEKAAREARYTEAWALATRAERATSAALADNPAARANASTLLGAIALFADPAPPLEKIELGESHLLQAASYFPLQSGMAEMEPALAYAMSWLFAAQTLRRMLGHPQRTQTPEFERALRSQQRIPTSRDCGLIWKKIKIGEYPRKALIKGDVGFVLVAYDLDKNLRPVKAKVVGEAPGAFFGGLALDAVRDGRMKRKNTSQPLDEACYSNRLTAIYFRPGPRGFDPEEIK